MKNIRIVAALAAGLALGSTVGTAVAGDRNGDFMVRAGVSVVDPQSSARVRAGGTRIPGADADVSTKVIPSATLTYFFTNNISAELFCCFSKHSVKGKGSLAGVDLGDTWIFPPAVTFQYHFDTGSAFKPYVGAGVQYITFFDESRSALPGRPKLHIDDAWGFTLQAGLDYEIRNGWYLNFDVKKTWLDADAKWKGTNIRADVDIDPWIMTMGVGYRFNLSDVFGSRFEAERVVYK